MTLNIYGSNKKYLRGHMLNNGDSTEVSQQTDLKIQSLKGALGSVGVLEIDFLDKVDPLSDAPEVFR